jgi:hypothetical protein
VVCAKGTVEESTPRQVFDWTYVLAESLGTHAVNEGTSCPHNSNYPSDFNKPVGIGTPGLVKLCTTHCLQCPRPRNKPRRSQRRRPWKRPPLSFSMRALRAKSSCSTSGALRGDGGRQRRHDAEPLRLVAVLRRLPFDWKPSLLKFRIVTFICVSFASAGRTATSLCPTFPCRCGFGCGLWLLGAVWRIFVCTVSSPGLHGRHHEGCRVHAPHCGSLPGEALPQGSGKWKI